ncbi:hypothetical protein [Caballeronia sp. DA-9]|uniref:hypothetical protein n=1 Tax=Caballeronia sp. DA-9 TaxID=3436237 RepID=UPI003F67075A
MKRIRARIYWIYCGLYADLLFWLEQHQPGAGGMNPPNRVIVSRIRWDTGDGWIMRKDGSIRIIRPGESLREDQIDPQGMHGGVIRNHPGSAPEPEPQGNI